MVAWEKKTTLPFWEGLFFQVRTVRFRACSSHVIGVIPCETRPRLWALGILKRSTGTMSMLSPALMGTPVHPPKTNGWNQKTNASLEKATPLQTIHFGVSWLVFQGELGFFEWRRLIQPQQTKTLAGDSVTVLINPYKGMMPGEIRAAVTKTNELVVLIFYGIVHYLGNS